MIKRAKAPPLYASVRVAKSFLFGSDDKPWVPSTGASVTPDAHEVQQVVLSTLRRAQWPTLYLQHQASLAPHTHRPWSPYSRILHPQHALLLHLRQASGTDEKTCQTYRQTLPKEPAEARHPSGPRSLPRDRSRARRHHSWARGIGSSARLESVAHVENTVADVYYRNDSMKSGVCSQYCCAEVECVARWEYSQSRLRKKEEREGGVGEIFVPARASAKPR